MNLTLESRVRKKSLQRQINRLESILSRLDGWDRRYTRARLICFLSGIAALILVSLLQLNGIVYWVLAAFLTAFAVIVFLHRRIDFSRLRFRLALSLAKSQLARIDLNWEDIPAANEIPFDPGHPYASDLNIVGTRSLHQLIDTAASLGGSRRLAAWFLNPQPDPDSILKRHAVLQELAPLAGFRSRLALKGLVVREETKGYWDGEKIMKMIETSIAPRSFLPALIFLSFLAAVDLILFILNVRGLILPYWLIGLGLYAFTYLARFNDYKTLFEDTYFLGKSLIQFRSILVFLENASYAQTPDFARFCKPFTGQGKRPSQVLRRMAWITIAASLGNNPVFSGIINAIVPWNLFFAFILNGYKKEVHDSLREWLDAWYEIEGLCSLANFSYLNPSYTLPDMKPSGVLDDMPVFLGWDLGHPLIPETSRVCNDFTIESLGKVALITGSNMSGKSTFLRTIGINLCLANCGAPVAAAKMNTRLFRLFTCIQVSDSLADGISYFYAEVRRLKQLLVELEKPSEFPLFFLIDEIYRGTNNLERRIGSQAFIHALSHSQGIGVVSTHDLDLVTLSGQDPNILNYHFREEIQGNRMIYDYRLRNGPSPTTNALKIMEIEGLPTSTGPV